jgi:hypothetical protein
LHALTGQQYGHFSAGSNPAPVLTTAFQSNMPVTAGTPDAFTSSNSALAQQLNLLSDHVYYVTSFDPSTGLIQLGNPWGTAAAFTPAPMTVQQFEQLGLVITA